MRTRWRISLTAVVLAFALAACQSGVMCGEVDCTGPSIVVDLSKLPTALRHGVALTGCLDGTCKTQRVGNETVPGEGVLSSMLIAMPEGSDDKATTTGTVEIRIDRGGRQVFDATTSAHLPIWHKKTRCPDCKSGNAFVVVEPDGTIRSRSAF